MQNIKKILLYSTLIFSMQTEHDAYAKETLEVASTILVEGLKDTTKMAGESINILAENHLTKAGDLAKETIPKLGSETVANLVAALDALKAIGTVITIYSLSKDAISYLWPSKEETAHATEVEDEYQSLVAKKAFKECLLKKAHTEKNSSGIPCACEESAQLYAMMAGIQKANDIKEAYNKYF